MPTNLQDLDKVSLDKTFDFYKDRFADASEQTFIIVGAFDMNAIKPFIETYIASLPALNKKQDFIDRAIRAPTGKISKTVYKGLEDKAAVELYIHGDYTFNADNNVQMDALKGALEIKILERLREKESGVYSPQVGLSLEKYPAGHYYFNISFSCAPANVEKLIAAALDEVNKIKAGGASVDDITKFKSEEQRQYELNLRNNNYWLSYLSSRLKNGENLDQLLGEKQRLDSVSVESTKATAQKYLNEDNYIRLVLLPQQK
jgi:zinc protease